MPDILSPTGIEKPLPGELHSRAQYLRNLDRINDVAIDTEDKSTGIGEIKNRSSTSAGITSTLSIIENIPSFSFKGGRKYRIVWNASYTNSVVGTYYTIGIHHCSTLDASSLNTGLTLILDRSITSQDTGGEPLFMETIFEPVADSILQIKFTAIRATGTGTFTMESRKSQFYIEEIGVV